MPLYLLSVCYQAGAEAPDEKELARIMADVQAVAADLAQAGAWVFGGGLEDASTATVVVDRDGEPVLTDGPFIESKEQIGGFSVIEAADLDEAVSWARKQSAATKTPIEVRPLQPGARR